MMEKIFSSTILTVDGVKFQNVSLSFLFAGSLQKGSCKVNSEYFNGKIRPNGERFSSEKNHQSLLVIYSKRVSVVRL